MSVKIAARLWIVAVQNRLLWKVLGTAFVRQWISFGCDQDEMKNLRLTYQENPKHPYHINCVGFKYIELFFAQKVAIASAYFYIFQVEFFRNFWASLFHVLLNGIFDTISALLDVTKTYFLIHDLYRYRKPVSNRFELQTSVVFSNLSFFLKPTNKTLLWLVESMCRIV